MLNTAIHAEPQSYANLATKTVSQETMMADDTEPSTESGESHFPPWHSSLQHALQNNKRDDDAHLYASLATIKSFGRPSNRAVYFRGFLSDGLVADGNNPDHKEKDKHRHQVANHALTHAHIERLSNVLVFVVDARSGSIEDLIHGSKFGEICWIFPETRDQFRLSGHLHLVVSPTHPLSLTHQIPTPFAASSHFPHLNWENIRQDMWRSISATRRASFTWPTSRHDLNASGGHGFHQHGRHPSDSDMSFSGGNPATHSPAALKPTIVKSIEVSSSSEGESATTTDIATGAQKMHLHESREAKQHYKMEDAHKDHALSNLAARVALQNFALLLLDVDGADTLHMACTPHSRIKYRRTVDAVAPGGAGEGVIAGSTAGVGIDRVFSVDDVIREGPGSHVEVGGVVRQVARWSIKNVLE
ncbi:pyridoxamine 5'-phosphate oxidase-domain-containing protein [Chytriomyces sp. MP71]|nr:pyridoxamine 5'-phosphate oxidase-domain-containing protein [Chytriomyces sp. MP71]